MKRISTLAGLVAIVAWAPNALAEAAPATLHLTAAVYDIHESNGVVSSKEKLHQGTTYVGEDYSRCQLSENSAHCVGSYTLRHGKITFSGTISNASNTNRLTITGGTGTYKGVHGSVLTEYNKAGTKAKETLTF